MKILSFGSCLLLTVLAGSNLLGAEGSVQLTEEEEDQKVIDRHGWYNNYEVAREAALESGKPIMAVFRCVP